MQGLGPASRHPRLRVIDPARVATTNHDFKSDVDILDENIATVAAVSLVHIL